VSPASILNSPGRSGDEPRQQEKDVRSIARPRARQLDLLRVDVDTHRTQAEPIGDEQRGGAVAAADIQVRPRAGAVHGGDAAPPSQRRCGCARFRLRDAFRFSSFALVYLIVEHVSSSRI
jgi:hypothetical protein